MVGFASLGRFFILFVGLFGSLGFFSFQAFAQNAIVSDLDDTLKRTNVENPAAALYNAMFTQDVFAEMDGLFRTMAPTADLYILSASPKIFMYNIEELMEENDLAPVDIYARDFEDMDDKVEYKFDTVKEVLDKGYERLILMGDDVEEDPKIYDEFHRAHPGRVAGIYIHKVTGAALPDSAVGYYTSFGVAVREVLAGRMSVAEAWSLGEAFLAQDMEEAFPDFVVCPQTIAELGIPVVAGLEDLTERISKSVVRYCRGRD